MMYILTPCYRIDGTLWYELLPITGGTVYYHTSIAPLWAKVASYPTTTVSEAIVHYQQTLTDLLLHS